MMPLTNELPTRRLRFVLLFFSSAFIFGGVLLSKTDVNQQWMIAINQSVSGIDSLWSVLTQFGEGGVALLLLLVFARFSRNGTALSLKCFLIGSVLSPSLKAIFAHARPLSVLDAGLIHTIGYPPTAANSMPSGHSMTVIAAVTLLCLCLPVGSKFKPVAALLVVFGSLVALSRIMVGAHWPSDVLAGGGLGILIVWLAVQWEQFQPWSNYLKQSKSQWGLMLCELGLVIYLFRLHAETPASQLAIDVIATLGIAGLMSRLSLLRKKEMP
jgi:membrane-associated phospholipid phosphatase